MFTATALGLPDAQGAVGAWVALGPGVDTALALPRPLCPNPLWEAQEGPWALRPLKGCLPSPHPTHPAWASRSCPSCLPGGGATAPHSREGAAGLRGRCALVSRFRQ